MKNKTIQILAEGKWSLPVGTKYKNLNNCGSSDTEWCVSKSLFEFIIGNDLKNQSGNCTEVDFSNVEKLYPHKGMDVPKEGIQFVSGNGGLLDAGNNGFTWSGKSETHYYQWTCLIESSFELKRVLPKTIEVCSECFKGVCECGCDIVHYRCKWGYGDDSPWKVHAYSKKHKVFYVLGSIVNGIPTEIVKQDPKMFNEIDWNNPINVIPEGKDQ